MLGSGFAPGYGWINGEWRKNPLLLGYSATVAEHKFVVAPSAFGVFNSSTVPSGEIWVITTAAIRSQGASGLLFAEIYAITDGTSPILSMTLNVVQWQFGLWSGQVVLELGDNIRFVYAGADIGATIEGYYVGFRVDIDQ